MHHPNLRLVDMSTACTHPDIKNTFLEQFGNLLAVFVFACCYGVEINGQCFDLRRLQADNIQGCDAVAVIFKFSSISSCCKFFTLEILSMPLKAS